MSRLTISRPLLSPISTGPIRNFRPLLLVPVLAFFLVIAATAAHFYRQPPLGPPRPSYKPAPSYTPPPIVDPFASLRDGPLPPVPSWNQPREKLHVEYGLEMAPPLMIGFTRGWPLLLQTVVSYITAGWPAEQIFVVENTGVQRSNEEGRLTLQHPFFLDYAALRKLGVNVVRTPVLMSFAQLQNFYTHTAIERGWPWYFWGHQDVLVLSFENGEKDLTPRYDEEGYKTIYELASKHVNETLGNGRWGIRFFAYDHLTLVNVEAYEAVGGWDTFVPYYMTDCDMHSRLAMDGWSQQDKKAGIVTDVSTALEDLRALYRDKTVRPRFKDPNPPPPKKPRRKSWTGWLQRRKEQVPETTETVSEIQDPELRYWDSLRQVGDTMFHYKHGERGRNTWQMGQRGGRGEPYYYPAEGIEEAVTVMTEAGREVFRRKWGHRDCALIADAGLKREDAWMVVQDWDD